MPHSAPKCAHWGTSLQGGGKVGAFLREAF